MQWERCGLVAVAPRTGLRLFFSPKCQTSLRVGVESIQSLSQIWYDKCKLSSVLKAHRFYFLVKNKTLSFYFHTGGCNSKKQVFFFNFVYSSSTILRRTVTSKSSSVDLEEAMLWQPNQDAIHERAALDGKRICSIFCRKQVTCMETKKDIYIQNQKETV